MWRGLCGSHTWVLFLLAVLLLESCPSRACTVYDLYSHGLAASLWHMIPASVLFADNGTFFVRPHATKIRCFALRQRETSPFCQVQPLK